MAGETACCAEFYERPWVRRLANEVFHPGGPELTRRTLESLELEPAARVLDLGCGAGSSALLAVGEFGFEVAGMDCSAANTARARARAREQGARGARFIAADAQALPFATAAFDGAVAECAFSLFADKRSALNEVRRVLKPRARFAVTDMAVAGDLPGDLVEVLAPWTCLADACDRDRYAMLFRAAGLEVALDADESAGLAILLSQLKRKLVVLGTGMLMAGEQSPSIDIAQVKYWLGRLGEAVDRGQIRYLRFLLRRGS